VQQDQREQADGFGLWQKAYDETAQVQRVFAEVPSNERLAGCRGIPFVVHEVHDLEDSVETLRELGARGNLIGDPFCTDPLLRPRNPPLHGLRSDEECTRHLLGREATDLTERERKYGHPAAATGDNR